MTKKRKVGHGSEEQVGGNMLSMNTDLSERAGKTEDADDDNDGTIKQWNMF